MSANQLSCETCEKHKRKKCIKCLRLLALTSFSANKRQRDGRNAWCRQCYAEYRQRPEVKVRQAAASRRYYQTRKGRDKGNQQSQIYRKRYPRRHKAVRTLNNRLRYNHQLRAGQCASCCGTNRLQAHHPDYEHPLQVIWLCEPCHKALHAKLLTDSASSRRASDDDQP